MLIIEFKNSRSPKFREAIKYAKVFENHSFDETDINTVDIQLKEIFEKWDDFNMLFWTVLNWKGTTVEYEGMKYHAHSDKTSIFYAIQQSYYSWQHYTRYKLSNLDKVYTGQKTMVEIEGKYLTDEQVNNMIDEYILRKK